MIVNLTPHALHLFGEDNSAVATIPPSGVVARVTTSRQRIGEADGLPLFRTAYGEVQGLPEPAENTLYVVSGLVRAAVQRPDVWQPGELVRDSAGAVIGAIGLSQ